MASEGNALLLKTSEITARLADDFAALQSARRPGNAIEEKTRLEEQANQTRKEIEDIGGWYYACENAPAVAWPESKVQHSLGIYGQPMCDGCKKYALDHSTIFADFIYCLHEVSSEKICFKNRFQRGSRQERLLLAAPLLFSSYTLHRAPVCHKKKGLHISENLAASAIHFPVNTPPPLPFLAQK